MDGNFVTTHTPGRIKGKVTVVPLDEMPRRQRGATEACFLHIDGSNKADDCHGNANAVMGRGDEQLRDLIQRMR